MSAVTFFKEFTRNWQHTGAVFPSSPALARAIVAAAEVAKAKHVLELGPGTGPFTDLISKSLAPDSRYLGVELNPAFVAALRKRFPHLDFAEAAAQEYDFTGWLPEDTGFDSVVSGLPWTAFPTGLQRAILGHVLPRLAPGGKFATFAYTGLHLLPGGRSFRRLLAEQECRLTMTSTVWANVPPAFIYVLTRHK
ncbi:MAG: methyltransferase domain-containing protein [Verrucomicrobiaceae bacterium]|nr:methyltransferase domain-containing protein [Verrucomicrobiaceae bacterium]